MSRKPHFMIIGAMKSATSTLQEQLASQDGIFMCSPKEPNFFSDADQWVRGLDWYESLFESASSSDLCGEASTHYTKLPTHPETVSRLAQYEKGIKFVYIMRHPIDRLISHYVHEWSMNNIKGSIDEALHTNPELVTYGQYSHQLKPWFEAFGMTAVLPVFFDRLRNEPQAELERICKFIGYTGVPVWKSDMDASNVSRDRVRRFPGYQLLVESAAATWLRRSLVPKSVRSTLRSRLTMQERPALSPDTAEDLSAIFNDDLAHLGAWLGQELTTENFKAVTAQSPLDWR